MRLSVTAALAFLLSSVSAVLSFPAPQDYGILIALRSDGLHALPYWYYTNGYANLVPSLWVWSGDADTGHEVICRGPDKWYWPSIEITADNKACVVDYGSYETNIGTITNPTNVIASSGEVSTFDLATGQRTDFFRFADDQERWGASCSLASGGLVFINYNQQGPPITFDLNYRFPPSPPVPGGASVPTWAPTVRYALPAANGEIASSVWQAVQFNGLVWVFLTRDSSEMLVLIRFKETSSGMQLFDYYNMFISGFSTNGVVDPLAVHGELPDLSVRVDTANNRIVAAYEADKGNTNSYLCGGNWARLNVIAVYPDLSKQLIQWTPYYSERVRQLTCFARSDAVYYIQDYNTLDPFCLDGFITASTKSNSKPKGMDIHGPLATCPDGWIAYQSSTGFRIEQMNFRPTMNISKTKMLTRQQVMTMAQKFTQNEQLLAFPAPDNVSVSWDNGGSNDTLQGTADFTNWSTVVTNAVSPVILPSEGNKYFRVQTN